MESWDKDALLQLARHRDAIDRIDDQLIALLKERIGIVRQVGELKRSQGVERCFIKAGREALMVRRMYDAFEDSDFNPAAAAAIWRQIIAASTSCEHPLSVVVPETHPICYWLAHEYFGAFTPIHVASGGSAHALGDLVDDKAGIAVLPIPPEPHDAESRHVPWWVHLAIRENAPSVFACLPYLLTAAEGWESPPAVALAYLQPEAGGEDVTLIAIESKGGISQHAVTHGVQQAGLEAEWLTQFTGSEHWHLLRVEGFHRDDHPKLQKLRVIAPESILTCKVLGSYASPIIETKE